MHRDRFFSFFITRLLIAILVFYGEWRLGDDARTVALGRGTSVIVDRAMATVAALVAMLSVGGFIERRWLHWAWNYFEGVRFRDASIGCRAGRATAGIDQRAGPVDGRRVRA